MSENVPPIADGAAAPPAGRRFRRGLSPFDRWVRAPLGFLWLGVIAIVAVPAIVTMTILYYTSRGLGRLSRGRAASRPKEA